MTPIRLSAKETKQFERKVARMPYYKRPAPLTIKSRMPANALRADCKCGIRIQISSTPPDSAEMFVAAWWKRHTGPGHGPVKKGKP